MQNTNGNPYKALFDYQGDISPDQLRQARRKLKLVETQYRLKRLEGLSKLVEAATAPEYWTNVVYDRLDRYRNDPWGSSYANQHDRRHGRNYPVFQNEQELGLFRMQSRILCATNSYAIGLVEGVSAYVLGTGCTYRAISRHEERPAPEELLQALQDILDDFMERNQWFGGGMPGVEDEFFWRTCEDGEAFLVHYRDQGGNTEVRFAEPEQITQPLGSPFEEYGFGILTPVDDVQRHLAVNVRWDLAGDHEEEIPIGRVVHLRRNAKRNIKRGLTDFSFETLDVLHVAGKLNRNMSLGAAIQACYAGVRQHANATKTEVGDLQELLSTFKQTDVSTGRTEYYQKHEPGVYDVPEGQTWVNPPTAQNAAAHVEILQACLRGAGVRWNAPEWLTSGLHDTSSFASSLTAESPFLRRIQREQRNYTGAFERSMWIAIENHAQAERGLWVGMIVEDADGRDTGRRADRFFSWDEIKRLVEIEGKAPDPTTRDKTQEAQANQIYLQGGIKSPQTVQQELGLDPEQERVNMEEWKEMTGGQGAALPMPGDDGTPPATAEPEPEPEPEPDDGEEPDEPLDIDDLEFELATDATEAMEWLTECEQTKKPGPCKKNKVEPKKKKKKGKPKASAVQSEKPDVVPGADGKRKSAAASVAAAAAKDAPRTLGTPAEHAATAKTIIAAWKSGGATGMSARDLHDALAVRHPGISKSQTLAAIQSMAAESGGKIKITRKNSSGQKVPVKPADLTPHIAALAKAKESIEHGGEFLLECEDADLPSVPALDVPDRRQDTSFSCGATCLQSVLAFFGKEQDEGTLRQQLGTTFADGTDADRIVEVAKERGLSAAVQQGIGLDGLARQLQAGHPVIALIQAYGTGHYVVAIGMDDDTVTIQDPNAGRLEMPADEFAARWVWVDKDNVALRQLGIPIGK